MNIENTPKCGVHSEQLQQSYKNENLSKHFTNTLQITTTDGSVKSIVNKQYNSPVGIYSDESIAETLSAQAEVLAGGVLG